MYSPSLLSEGVLFLPRMICFPNAKINLGLQILKKRDDGFHEIKTCMYPIAVNDALEFHSSNSFSFKQSGKVLDNAPEDNIIVKTYELLKTKIDNLPELNIHLLKNIPFGAGLGGGSADAAFFMTALIELLELGVTSEQQEEWISEIGSDCAFFIKNIPAIASGRGEILTPIQLKLSEYSIQLICPTIHVSTATAYSGVLPTEQQPSLENILLSDIATWKQTLVNDFEKSVFTKEPILANIKNQLYAGGALYASMSGSGSSVFGIFPKNKKADIKIDIDFEEFIC